MLPYISPNTLEECFTNKGEANLKKTGDTHFYLHDPEGAKKEAEDWFEKLSLQKLFLVCVYGVGLGYYYDAIKPWLKKNRKRQLVFLEDDLMVIHKLLETEKGTKILHDPQVQLIYFKDTKEDDIFAALYWNFAMTRLVVSALHSYAGNKAVVFEELKHKITYDAALKNALVDEYLRFGANFYINFYQNMLCLPESYLGNKLFGKFENVPAIICGAGPSLGKHLPMLAKLKDKAMIFAGGSAFNVLNAAGLQPHFGASIDPNPMQQERLASNQGYEVPFFYRNRVHHAGLKMIHGPRLYITGAGGYDTAEFFEKKFKIKSEYMDEGHNVVNFCVQIAHQLKCNPIIFVGMDLAYTGMQRYAPGVVDETAITDTAILDIESSEGLAFVKNDIFGKPTYTLWKWVAESEWIGEFAKEHTDLSFVNSTEGGLGFPGVPNLPLKEVEKKFLGRSYELQDRIHGELVMAKLTQVTNNKIVRAMRALSRSLKRTLEYLDILSEEAKSMQQLLKLGKEAKQSGSSALAEIELSEEDGYKHVVDVFNEVFSRTLTRDVYRIHLKHQTEGARLSKKIPLTIGKYLFLKDVAKVNIELIDYAFRERKKIKPGNKILVKIPPTIKGEYYFDGRHLLINDPEMGLHVDEKFAPLMIPEERQDGKMVKDHKLRVFFSSKWKLQECFLEKDGILDGQCLLFYPTGAIKQCTYYQEGKLHGSAIFFDPEGKEMASSWFIKGQQEGKSYWYYSSGGLYSIQRYHKNVWHGRQEFYYENGNLKTLMNYKHGKLMESPILLKEDGSPDRQG